MWPTTPADRKDLGKIRSVLAHELAVDLDDAAEILEVPEGTVRTRVFHARKKLRALLEGSDGG